MKEPTEEIKVEECKADKHVFTKWSSIKIENGIRFQSRECLRCNIHEAQNPITDRQSKLFELMKDKKYWRGAPSRELSKLLGYKNIEPIARWIKDLKYKGYLNERGLPIEI